MVDPRTTADVAARRLQAVRQRALGRDAVERVLQETVPYPPQGGGTVARSEQIEALLSDVSIEPRGADSYELRYVHRDPVKAALVPNRLAGLLLEANKGDESGRADPALLEARLVAARKVIEEKEAALRRLRDGLPRAVLDPTAATPTPVERLDSDRRAVALELSAARARADRLRLTIDADSQPVPADGSASAELAALRAQRAELRKRYTDEHPDVEALTRRIRRLEAAMPSAVEPTPTAQLQSLRAQLADVEAEIEALTEKEAALAAEGARLAAPAPPPRAVRSASPSKPDVAGLARELEQAQASYLALEAEWRTAETASRLGRGPRARFEILQPAAVPTGPSFPNRPLFGLFGLGFGLALGLAAAVAAETRDRTVKDAEELQELLSQPVLAQIPFVRVLRSSRRG